MKIDSDKLKAAVMSYYRFERGGVCATEVTYSKVGGMADVLVDMDDEIIEIETKIDKVDLTVHEAVKPKHDLMRDHIQGNEHKFPNKFYICVPRNLEKTATKFIEETNPNYGLIIFDTRVNKIDSRSVKVARPAKKIHTVYNQKIKKAIILRLCSEIANVYEKKANNEEDSSGKTKAKHKRDNSKPVQRQPKERQPSERMKTYLEEIE